MNQTGVLSAVFWCLILSSSAKGESFAPPQGKTLLVVGQDHTTIQDYLRATGVVPAGFMRYTKCDWEVLPLFRGQGWGDARIQADPAVKKAWLEETAKERYLHSSPQFFSTLRFSVDTHLQP